MTTKLNIDPKLLAEAKRLGSHKSNSEAVTAALTEYVQRRIQMGILKLFGKIDYDPSYDYKAQRRRR